MATMKNLLSGIALISLSAFAFAAQAQEAKMLTQCMTRKVEAAYSGTTWMKQTVCSDNEVAISGSGFCLQAGAMIGASTTQNKIDRDVWLWCAKGGAAVWYGVCCQSAPIPVPAPVKALKSCITRKVEANFSGGIWMDKQVCQANEVAVSGGGFCSKAGQMIGASTTQGTVDGKVWLQCTAPGPAVWYGVCCQQ